MQLYDGCSLTCSSTGVGSSLINPPYQKKMAVNCGKFNCNDVIQEALFGAGNTEGEFECFHPLVSIYRLMQ